MADRRHAALAGTIALLALGWILWSVRADAPMAPSEEPAQASPTTPRVARPMPPPPAAAQPSAPAPVAFTIHLGDARDTPIAHDAWTVMDSLFLLLPDQEQAPEHPAIDALYARFRGEEPWRKEEVLAQLEQAARDGFDADPERAIDSPERAILELEMERARTHARWGTDYERWVVEDRRAGPRPVQDLDRLATLVDAVLVAYPDGPTADVARFYRALAQMPAGGDRDTPRDLGPAVDAVFSIASPALAEEAAARLPLTRETSGLVVADLHDLAGLTFTRPAVRERVLAFIVREAHRMGRHDLASDWLEAYATSIDAGCEASYEPAWCVHQQDRVDAGRGQLAALLDHEPRDWRAALAAAAWRCHLDVGPQRGESVGTANWVDGWSWASWTSPTAVTDCLARGVSGPPPPEDTAVQLTLSAPD